jgi:hypothetical protein
MNAIHNVLCSSGWWSRRVEQQLPGGTFAGTDSVGEGHLFRLIHASDTLNLLDPDDLPGRLEAAGMAEPRVDRGGRPVRFRARRPG